MADERESPSPGRTVPRAGSPDRERVSSSGPADETAPEDDATLDTGVADVITALSEHGAHDPKGSSSIQADSFTDIWDTFARLRDALGLPSGMGTAADPAGPSRSEPVSAALLENAMAGARGAAAWYRDSPEWQNLTRVTYAARTLVDAIRSAAGDYWSEISQDIRVRGFVRTVAARACRAVASCAGALAAKLEQADGRQSAAWRAISLLHRTASPAANQIIGYQPPVHEADRIIAALERRQAAPTEARQQADGRSPAMLAALSFPVPVSQASTAAPGPARQRAGTETNRRLGGSRR